MKAGGEGGGGLSTRGDNPPVYFSAGRRVCGDFSREGLWHGACDKARRPTMRPRASGTAVVAREGTKHESSPPKIVCVARRCRAGRGSRRRGAARWGAGGRGGGEHGAPPDAGGTGNRRGAVRRGARRWP